MDPILLTVVTLRSLGALFGLQGKPEIAGVMNASAAAIEAGRSVDAQMQEVADLLNSGGDLPSWSDLARRIDDETAQFLAP